MRFYGSEEPVWIVGYFDLRTCCLRNMSEHVVLILRDLNDARARGVKMM